MGTRLEIIQGASYAEDFSDKTVTSGFDEWSGRWSIIDKLGDAKTVFASGNLSVDMTASYLKFKLRIPKTVTIGIAPNKYKLIVKVDNASNGYSNEVVRRDFKIVEKGID